MYLVSAGRNLYARTLCFCFCFPFLFQHGTPTFLVTKVLGICVRSFIRREKENIARPAADARPDKLQKESYRLSSTCCAPRNHTNVPPVDAHVWRQLHLSAVARCSDSYCIFFVWGIRFVSAIVCIVSCFYLFSPWGNFPLQSYWSLSCDHGLHCSHELLWEQQHYVTLPEATLRFVTFRFVSLHKRSVT